MLSRPVEDFATPQSNRSPVPPRALSLYASSRIRSASYASNASGERTSLTRSAFITLTPPRCTAVTVSGVSSPWSCAKSSPTSREILRISAGSSSTNTPTLRMSPGSAREIRRASSTPTQRGLSAKTKPTASAPASAATRASLALVIPHILTRVITRSVPLIVGGESQNLGEDRGAPRRSVKDVVMYRQSQRKICPVDYYLRVERREKLRTARPCTETGGRTIAGRRCFAARRYHRAGCGGAEGERHGWMDPRLPYPIPAPVELGLGLYSHRAGPPRHRAPPGLYPLSPRAAPP